MGFRNRLTKYQFCDLKMNKMNKKMKYFIRCQNNSESVILLSLINYLETMIANKSKEKNKVWISRTEHFRKRYSSPNIRKSVVTSEHPNQKQENCSFIVAWQMQDEEEWEIR